MKLLEYLDRPDADVDLAGAALCLAKDEYPQLDTEHYLTQLDALAGAVGKHSPRGPASAHPDQTTEGDTGAIVDALRVQLFEHQGFKGNATNYYDPRNSFLNDVLDRRTGIPITLSLVYMEVAQRLGLSVSPVSFPSHFLVRININRLELVIDPFNRGTVLDRETLLAQLVQLFGERDAAEAYLPQALASVPRREVIARMLRNLKAIYISKQDWARALRVTDQLVHIDSNQPQEVRDRGHLYESLECAQAALDDYQRYLAQQPDAVDAARIKARIHAMQKLASRLN